MPDDPGLRALEELRDRFAITPEWSIDEDRGFTWWPLHFGQRIWAERPYEDDGLSVSTLHATTDLLTGIEDERAVWSWLSRFGPLADMSCLELDEGGTLRLHSRVEAHREIADWDAWLLGFAALTQLYEAQQFAVLYLGPAVRGELSPGTGTLVTRDHPLSGHREEPDPLYFSGLGADANGYDVNLTPRTTSWIDAELDAIVEYWGTRSGQIDAAVRRGGVVKAAVQFGDDVGIGEGRATIEVAAGSRHPERGPGVTVLMSLPLQADSTLVGWLNRMDGLGDNTTHLLGNWWLNPVTNSATFGTFVMDRILRPGLLFNLMTSSARRARWAHTITA